MFVIASRQKGNILASLSEDQEFSSRTDEMKALPSEPLVCMDQVDPDDTAAVETPVERAMDCVAAVSTRLAFPRGS